MGYVKTQADAALKAGNYKDAYTMCVMLHASFIRHLVLVLLPV